MEQNQASMKEEENRVLRYNRVIKGINRIFSNVKAKTEEKLGNTCLSVAIEITDSQYGFIGEVDHDRRLHDIAVSDMGWERCMMYDKTGNRRSPSDFILHGLYGRVIDSGKSFFTNDLQTYTYSIGVLPGHPSLISFLGVPLIEEGKVIGMLAVANREGGYSYEQLEDLEAIAPAVTEALTRNKAEKVLLDANEQIHTQSDELLIQSIELKVQNDKLQAYSKELHIKNEELQAQSEEIYVQNEELQSNSEMLHKANESLQKSEKCFRILSEDLEILVRERTEDLEQAYNSLKEIETIRKQEIHHRIKNNLQVISSLLDLQAEQFRGKKNIEYSQVLEAFRESQDRVISMALIHEELHKGGELNKLNFLHYIEVLADNLLLSYNVGNDGIGLHTDIDKDIFFDMDTAVPLGMIINELISNSLKYAFPYRDNAEIQIKLHREENGKSKSEDCNTVYVLSVSDNGVGIPENLDIEELDSLGLQLVTTLVEQLDGELELRRDNGTEFTIKFSLIEKDKHEER